MKKLFGKIAPEYDRMNRVMSLGLDGFWRAAAVRHDSLPQDAKVLDLACGTGDCSIEILKHRPEARIVGVDITPEMLDRARVKLAGRGAVEFKLGDAQDLGEFEAESFSLIVCAFGFRNFPDKAKALGECFRVLERGGQLVVLELFRPGSWLLGGVVRLWLILVAFLFARGFGKEYRYLRKSVAATVTHDEFVEMARRVGFSVAQKRFMPPAASCITLAKAQ